MSVLFYSREDCCDIIIYQIPLGFRDGSIDGCLKDSIIFTAYCIYDLIIECSIKIFYC